MTRLERLLDDAAGQPPRTLDLDRVHRRGRALRRTHMAIVYLVPVALVVAVLALLASVDTDEGTAPTFDVPPMDEVVGEDLPDDTPIWIVHDRDGSLYVVDAVDPDVEGHPQPGDPWASHWCPVGRYFESPWGARYELDGSDMGGPTRTGLTQRSFELDTDGTRITVGESEDEPMPTRVEPDRARPTCEGSGLVAHPDFEHVRTLWDSP